MTAKTATIARTDRDFEPFPDFPPREDMQNWIHIYSDTQAAVLVAHLGDRDTTCSGSEIPLVPSSDNRADFRIPDFLISFRADPSLMWADKAYVIDRQGKPPDFVLEVASVSTGVVDYTAKRADYARYGVVEYWRSDPSGGRYHDAALAGDRLVDGEYRPIEIEWLDESRCRGYSEALGLYVCWEDGDLRWFDPKTNSYIRTLDEEIERADSAEARAAAAHARAEAAEAELRALRQRLDDGR